MSVAAAKECPKCRGTGWEVRKQDQVESVVPCSRCRKSQRSIDLMRKSGLPPRYQNQGFAEFSTMHRLQQKALERAVRFVENFDGESRGLLFVGPCGVGKTHLAAAILKTIIEERFCPCRFVDETELLRRLQYSYGRDSAETEREVLNPLMHAPLVVWDDLGTGRPTEWVRETIHTVINFRYTHSKLTVFTTNLPIEPPRVRSTRADSLGLPQTAETAPWLGERLGQRLLSRLMEMCEVVRIEGPDHRIEILKASHDSRPS